MFEHLLHPDAYKVQGCRAGAACTRAICFFWHTPEEARVKRIDCEFPPLALASTVPGGRNFYPRRTLREGMLPSGRTVTPEAEWVRIVDSFIAQGLLPSSAPLSLAVAWLGFLMSG